MTTILMGFFIFSIIGLVGCIWGLICNERTFKQRIEMINMRSYDWYSVTYDQHFWRLFTFRNPYKIYRKFQ